MQSLNALIRVDGSETIGMGHVMRCLYLVRELSRRVWLRPTFAMKAFPNGVGWVQRQEFPVIQIPAASAPDQEVNQLATVLRKIEPDLVITDLRELTEGWPEAIRRAGILSSIIDEWGDRRILADLLTNGTVVPEWHRYQLQGQVDCYIGADYALMDPQFARIHALGIPGSGRPKQILLALGGDDPFRLTCKAIETLESIPGPLENTVVIGPAFIDAGEIRRTAERSKHRYTVVENTSKMAELAIQHDLAIVGGGLISLEMAASGTASLILCEVDHQLETAAALEQAGVACNLGLGTSLDMSKTAAAISGLLGDSQRIERMAEAGRQWIDGKGCTRIAEAILEKLNKQVPVA